MVRRVSEKWDEIEEGIRSLDGADTQQLQAIIGQIGNVRDALRTMCRVSVTRTSLKEAVREALIPVIQEHRDELFPEVVELQRRLADADPGALDVYRDGEQASSASEESTRDFTARLEQFEQRIAQLDSSLESGMTQVRSSLDHQVGAVQDRVGTVESRVGDVESRASEMESRVGDVESRAGELDSRVGSVESRVDGVDSRVSGVDGAIEAVRETVSGVQGHVTSIEGKISEVEASIPEQAKAAAEEVEARLRQEIADMVEQLNARLGELKEILARVESTVPTREMVSTVDARLEGLESSFARVAAQVATIESTTPEIGRIGDNFRDLRDLVKETSERVQEAGESVGSAVEQALSERIDKVEYALRDGIRRWENDQSEMSKRLGLLRDSLRDQLTQFSEQVKGSQGSLWGKITGNKDPGLKLSGEQFDQLSGKLEGIIGGLENVIARRKMSSLKGPKNDD